MTELLSKSLSSPQRERKTLNVKRLDLDASRSKAKKAQQDGGEKLQAVSGNLELAVCSEALYCCVYSDCAVVRYHSIVSQGCNYLVSFSNKRKLWEGRVVCLHFHSGSRYCSRLYMS